MSAEEPVRVVHDESAVNPADVRLAAMNLLARREHSRKELRQKLCKRYADPGVIETELDRLAEERLQSDGRYAESYARQRAGRGFGPLRVRQELRERGIDDSDIDIAFDAAEVDWALVAREVYGKKFGEVPPDNLKERARRSRFMQYRGFSQGDYTSHEE